MVELASFDKTGTLRHCCQAEHLSRLIAASLGQDADALVRLLLKPLRSNVD
jgi:hypothetical protein